MSHQAMSWAVEQRVGDALAKAVLMNLANRADETGRCFPGQERIARDTEISPRAVRNKLNMLIDMGLLDRARRDRGALRLSDEYQLAMPESEAAPRAGTVKANRHLTSGEPARGAGTTKDEPSGELTGCDARAGAREDHTFDRFWSGYPSKGKALGSQSQARTAWGHLSKADQNRALAALPAYEEYCTANHGWYQPKAPHRFLADRRFEGFEADANSSPNVIIERGTPQWDAWWPHLQPWAQRYIERNLKNTWPVPSEWPPGSEAAA